MRREHIVNQIREIVHRVALTDFIDALEPLNIEARYPSYKERLMKTLTEERCKELMKQTDELRLWIKSRL